MSFLSPLFLFGLLAAAIPLAIHLIRRDKPPRVVFSTLRFFRQTSRKQFLFQRIQQWLLMLLRTLAVLLLALAFARPFFSQSLSRWTDMAPRSVAVLVDVSMSMAYGDYGKRARSEAEKILADLNQGDEITLIFFSDQTRAVQGPTRDLSTVRAALEDMKPGFEKTRYFPALRLADEILSEGRFEDKSVYLISDFQHSGLSDLEKGWKLQPGVALTTINVADEKSRNLAITGVKSPPSLRGGKTDQPLFVRVRSLGSVHQDKAEVAVDIDGVEQWRNTVKLRDQSEAVVEVPVTFSGEGSHVGKVSVVDEQFNADNDYYFTVDLLPRIPVLVVNGEASTNWYDDEAHWFALAASSNQQSPFSLDQVPVESFSSDDLRHHKVVALLNVGRLSNRQAGDLIRFVREGGSILIAPGDQVEAASFNDQLSPISPAALLERGNPGQSGYLLISKVENRHPMFRSLDVDWGVRFGAYWHLKPESAAEVLMSFDNGAPALVEKQVGKGRVLIFASALDLEWNNMPLQGMYLPFVHEALKYLANTPQKKASYSLGERVPLADNAADNLFAPDGKALTLPEGEEGFTLQQPGIYRQEGRQGPLYYAVNRAVEESNLAAVAPATVVDQVLNPETRPIQSAEVRNRLLKMELEKPQRLWWWLLLAVMALLLAEPFVANRTYR